MTRRQRQGKYAAEHRHMCDRLLRLYELSDSTTQLAGRIWYLEAEAEVARLAHEFDLDLPAAAGIVAVLSPRQRWRKNIFAAEAVLLGHPGSAPGYWPNIEKAVQIAREGVLPSLVRGDKVRAFWRNLLGCRTSVTVDVWAQAAALGRKHPWQPKRGRYSRFAQAYVAAAARAGEWPREFQSIVWHQIRPQTEFDLDRRTLNAAP